MFVIITTIVTLCTPVMFSHLQCATHTHLQYIDYVCIYVKNSLIPIVYVCKICSFDFSHSNATTTMPPLEDSWQAGLVCWQYVRNKEKNPVQPWLHAFRCTFQILFKFLLLLFYIRFVAHKFPFISIWYLHMQIIFSMHHWLGLWIELNSIQLRNAND